MMFGLSLFKLLFLAAVVGAIWYGFKHLGKQQESAQPRATPRQARPRELDAEDMAPCKVCGTYVAVSQPAACARPDCPYRR